MIKYHSHVEPLGEFGERERRTVKRGVMCRGLVCAISQPLSDLKQAAIRKHRVEWSTVLVVVFAVAMLFATTDSKASNRGVSTATWYGPGFYGENFACEGRDRWTPNSYRRNVRGVAHMWLPCGAKVTLRFRHRVVRVRVIDTGNFGYNNFDLTARTAMDLCACVKPYTLRVRWKRGWTSEHKYQSNAIERREHE